MVLLKFTYLERNNGKCISAFKIVFIFYYSVKIQMFRNHPRAQNNWKEYDTSVGKQGKSKTYRPSIHCGFFILSFI